MATSSEVTRLLERMGSGETGASDALIPLIYKELRTLAAAMLKSERPGHTLQPTALVHEVYLKLVDQQNADYSSRGHFMAVAAMVMRRILVNHAKARSAAKRGGGAEKLPLSDDMAVLAGRSLDLVALDEAMNRLAERDARKAQVVEQRFFAGIK